MIVFGPYRIDEQRRQLLSGTQPLKIENIPLEILLMLIRERHRVVSREEIADQVWGSEKYVEAADGINTAIRKIRRALDDQTGDPRYIATVVGHGYRFTGEVSDGPESAAAPPTPQPTRTVWRLTRSHVLLGGAAILIAFGGWYAFRLARPVEPSFASLARLTSDTGFTGWPDISPDGKMLAYASNRADPDNLDIYIQPVEGNEAIGLTHHPSRDIAPVISPKGDQVAFESQREPPGIYVVPLLGGEARLLAKGGSRPRYSPNGLWIAYFKVEKAGRGSFRAYTSPDWSSWIMSASGGEPKALRPELVAGNPTWAGDDFVILTGNQPGGKKDWWVTPRDGSWTKPLDVYDALSKDSVDIASGWNTWAPAYFDNGSIVFSARTRDGANLWRIRFSSDWKPTFPPERVTMMSDHVSDASASATGRIAAAVMSRNNDVYEIPLDANTGVVKGEMHRLTPAKTSEQFASVSDDGTLVAYTSWRKGDPGDLYLMDRRTGVERQLTATKEWESHGRISPDGSSLFYKWYASPTEQQSRRLHLASGSVETICEKCTFMDQTADGKSFLFGDFLRKHIFVKDFSGGAATEPVHDESVRFTNASLDRANRWIAFVAAVSGDEEYRIFAAPFRRDARLARRDWVEMGTGLTPLWSPNGEWLYFDEGHDSFRCLWGQRFDPVAGRPVGGKIAVAHIHGDKGLIIWLQMKDRGLARDRMVFSITEKTSNIWLMR